VPNVGFFQLAVVLEYGQPGGGFGMRTRRLWFWITGNSVVVMEYGQLGCGLPGAYFLINSINQPATWSGWHSGLIVETLKHVGGSCNVKNVGVYGTL